PVGTGFIDTYMSYVEKNSNGIEIMYETRATEIIMENGKAVGVNAEGKDGNVVLKANKGVVVAAGGFGANIEMRDTYNKTWPTLTSLKTTNHPGATGDGMLMAEKIGANLIGMDNIQLLPMGDPVTGSLSGNIEQGVENRIFVNKDGNRFVDEGQRRDVMTKALFEQKDTTMWVIVDKHSYPTGDVKNNFNESIDELVAQGRAFKADTLEDLAKQIGANPENLVKAVEEFNKAVEKGGKDALGRTLFKDKLDSAPYYAGARVPTVHHTMGGIQINTSAQVLDKDGKIIPGLYAAGETTGGVHGSNRLGGNALADMTVFGRIAGESAAAGK
ncbi:MAG: ifcA, partial [Clostridia bacterium]|nr:ifcA [Clostridia bacterium]